MAGRWCCSLFKNSEIGVNSNLYKVDAEGFLSPSPTAEDSVVLTALSGYSFVPDPDPPPAPKSKPKKAVATAKKSIFKKKKK